jgi:hypothetical protein
MPALRPVRAAASALAALGAAVAAGAAESALAGTGWWAGVAATGFAAAYAAPLGAGAALSARALWRSWRPLAIADADGEGAAGNKAAAGRAAAEAGARVAGALGFAVAALLLVAAAGLAGVAAASSLTHVPLLAALTVGLFAVASGAVAVLLSIPVTRAVAAAVLAFDRRERARGRPGVTPARVLAVASALGGALATCLWLAVLVRSSRAGASLGPGPYLATFALALALAHALAARLRRSRPRAARILAAGVVALGAALALLTLRAATAHPDALRDARSRAPVGGLAIEASCDLSPPAASPWPGRR